MQYKLIIGFVVQIEKINIFKNIHLNETIVHLIKDLVNLMNIMRNSY
jgi:hypothetical protein